MEQRGFIKYAVIIVVILGLVYFSQSAYFKQKGQNLATKGSNSAQDLLTKGSQWVNANLLPKITGEVQKRGDIIKNEVNQEKNKATESIGQKISNYFSGVVDSVIHPGTAQNCPPTPAQTTTTK